MRAQAVLKASPIPLTPLAFRALVRRFDGGEVGFEEPYSIAARGWEKMKDPSAMIQGVFHLLQAVTQEPQEPHYVLMPYEHCNAV
jgi:hypothetical protein